MLSIPFRRYLKIITESRYVFLFNVVEKFFFFAIFLLFARKFPAEVYGKLITTFTLANIFIIILDFGLPILLQREISISGSDASPMFSRVIIIYLIMILFYFTGISVYYSLFYNESPFTYIFLAVSIVYLQLFIKAGNNIFSALFEFKYQFKILWISRTISLVFFTISVYALTLSVYTQLSVMLAGTVFYVFYIFAGLNSMGIKFSLKYSDKTEMIKLVKISFPLGLAVIFNLLYDKVDVIVISKFLDFSEVAYYNIGQGLYKSSALLFGFLLIGGFSKISYFSRRKKAVYLFLAKYTKLLLLICIAMNIVLFFGADLIIRIVFTDKFENSVLILRVLSFAITGMALNNLTGIVLNGIGWFRSNMYVTLAGLIINLGLNIIFVPVYGILAAAVITIITEYFILAGDVFFIKRYLRA